MAKKPTEHQGALVGWDGAPLEKTEQAPRASRPKKRAELGPTEPWRVTWSVEGNGAYHGETREVPLSRHAKLPEVRAWANELAALQGVTLHATAYEMSRRRAVFVGRRGESGPHVTFTFTPVHSEGVDNV